MTAEEFLKKYGIPNEEVGWFEDDIGMSCKLSALVEEYANQKALSIIEQAVGDEMKEWHGAHTVWGENILQTVNRKLGGGS